MNAEQVRVAKALRKRGRGIGVIARRIGANPNDVRKALGMEVRHKPKPKKGREFLHFQQVTPLHVKEDAERLSDEVPVDTRDLTGVVFGDPLPGRSALDRMRLEGRV